jgi:shikimate dehydrogenase
MLHLGGRTHLYLHLKDPHDVRGVAYVANPYVVDKKLDAFFVPVHVRRADFTDVLPRLAKLGNVKGFLVSMPFKEPILELCAELGPNARLVGSVNCVRIEAGGRLVGEMFDGLGLLRAANANGIVYAGRRLLLLGAGGAARAIAFAAVQQGVASIAIYNRTASRAQRLVEDVRVAFPQCSAKTSDATDADVDLVVSCIPGPDSAHLARITTPWLRPSTSVIDIVPSGDTALVTRARASGCKAMNGQPMIFHQLDAMMEFMGPPPTVT